MGEVTSIAPPRNLVTSKEVADYLQIPQSSVENMARRGKIPAFKVGGGLLWRFRMEDVEKWVEQSIEQQTKPRAKQRA